MSGFSKAKGSSFERYCCKALSLWVTGGVSKECFWRAALSGGRATAAMRRGDNPHPVSGDIAAVQAAGHILTDRFHIECKHLKNMELTSFILKHTGTLSKWWPHTEAAAR